MSMPISMASTRRLASSRNHLNTSLAWVRAVPFRAGPAALLDADRASMRDQPPVTVSRVSSGTSQLAE